MFVLSTLFNDSVRCWVCIASAIIESVCSIGGMILIGENRSTQRKSSVSATLSNTNPTWTGLGSNTGLYVEMLAANRLSHGPLSVMVHVRHTEREVDIATERYRLLNLDWRIRVHCCQWLVLRVWHAETASFWARDLLQYVNFVSCVKECTCSQLCVNPFHVLA